MHLTVRLYALLIIASAGLLAAADLVEVPAWTYTWSPIAGLALLSMFVLAVHFQFQVHSGWYTDASTVPAVATALLFPPGVGMLIAGIGLLAYTISTGSRHRLGLKGLFNTGSAMLAVGAAAHLASVLGGPTLLTSGPAWTAVPIAVLVSTAYYLVSAATVAGVLALDQQRSIWTVLRGKIGAKAVAEVALGLLGSTLAVVVTAAPGLSPALVLPGVLGYLAKKTLDRGERRSRDLALMSRVGRAVAGTLRPEIAFQAITAREVLDTLKLDGMALVPLGPTPSFVAHQAGDVDQPALCLALADQVSALGKRIMLGIGHWNAEEH